MHCFTAFIISKLSHLLISSQSTRGRSSLCGLRKATVKHYMKYIPSLCSHLIISGNFDLPPWLFYSNLPFRSNWKEMISDSLSTVCCKDSQVFTLYIHTFFCEFIQQRETCQRKQKLKNWHQGVIWISHWKFRYHPVNISNDTGYAFAYVKLYSWFTHEQRLGTKRP